MSPRVYVFTLCTFAFGSAAFIFAGLLEVMARDLGVSTAVAGQLQTAYVLTAALLGPLVAWALGRVDRKIVLTGALTLGVMAHLACAMTPDFPSLLGLRALAGLAGAVAMPAASIAAATLASPERRGSAIAMTSGGMTVAFVIGIPLGSVIGALFGWRATFVFAAGLSGLALAGVLAFMPRLAPAPRRVGGRLPIGHIWPLFLTTFLLFAANMTVNLYIAPLVRVGAGVTGARRRRVPDDDRGGLDPRPLARRAGRQPLRGKGLDPAGLRHPGRRHDPALRRHPPCPAAGLAQHGAGGARHLRRSHGALLDDAGGAGAADPDD
ncbi:MFS transporter [Phenylobacterium sp. J426]|uniref:MFS transporter n=1 Tax=Phenylobacterium sp. J426 TaxID=2898439 RepID=UPI002151461B|nr:MFS transporter [Phenylobacterium sp. J426]MCR5873279.1 MFS transporter [Phenylobacterium sp. J426]